MHNVGNTLQTMLRIFLLLEQVQLHVPNVSKVFDGKAVFAPRAGWFVAIQAHTLDNALAAAASALLSVKKLRCRHRLAGYFFVLA